MLLQQAAELIVIYIVVFHFTILKQKTGIMESRKAAINGASAKQNESETKVNKTMLLQQRIEENR